MTEIPKTSEWLWKDIDWRKATPSDIEKIIAAGGHVNDIAWEGKAQWREVDYDEHIPLELAISAENVAVVKFLLAQKADPNVVLASRGYSWGKGGISDYPLLSAAIRSDNQEIIDLLFKYGADPYAFDPKQKPKRVLPEHVNGGYVNSSKPMNGWGNHPLSVAIRRDNLKVLKKLTSAPYTISEAIIDAIGEIPKGYSDKQTTAYWNALVDQMTKKKRRILRNQLAEADRHKDTDKKARIIEQLDGTSPADIERVMSAMKKAHPDYSIHQLWEAVDTQTVRPDPRRKAEAKIYKEF